MIPWVSWFAWYPVRLTNGKSAGSWVWLETVHWYDEVLVDAFPILYEAIRFYKLEEE